MNTFNEGLDALRRYLKPPEFNARKQETIETAIGHDVLLRW